MKYLISTGLTILTVTIFVAGYQIYLDSKSPKLELLKSDWTCTKEETEITQIPMIVGKVTIMQNIVTTNCVIYTKN